MSNTKTTWLQCVIPEPEWKKLNERRQKLGPTWTQLIHPAAEQYLHDIEAGKVEFATEKKANTAKKSASEVSTQNAPATTTAKKQSHKKVPASNNSPTSERPADRNKVGKEVTQMKQQSLRQRAQEIGVTAAYL